MSLPSQNSSTSRHSPIIIGGTGLIGRALVKHLKKDGGKPYTASRTTVAAESFDSSRHLVGDISDPDFIDLVLSKSRDVIHLAYSSGKDLSKSDPLAELESNVSSAIRLFDALGKTQVDRLVMVSSGGTVYGTGTELPIVETCPTKPISSYGIAKATIDQYGLFFFRRHQIPLIVVRPGNVYGEEQQPFTGQGFIATAIGSILNGDPVSIYGDGTTVRDYIHVDDVATGIAAALEAGIPGEIYNIGTCVGTSNIEILDILEELAGESGFEVKRNFVDSRGIDVAVNFLDSTKLTDLSGWKPQVRLREGLVRIWNHTLKNNRGA